MDAGGRATPRAIAEDGAPYSYRIVIPAKSLSWNVVVQGGNP